MKCPRCGGRLEVRLGGTLSKVYCDACFRELLFLPDGTEDLVTRAKRYEYYKLESDWGGVHYDLMAVMLKAGQEWLDSFEEIPQLVDDDKGEARLMYRGQWIDQDKRREGQDNERDNVSA